MNLFALKTNILSQNRKEEYWGEQLNWNIEQTSGIVTETVKTLKKIHGDNQYIFCLNIFVIL